jgi:hypothetical protein
MAEKGIIGVHSRDFLVFGDLQVFTGLQWASRRRGVFPTFYFSQKCDQEISLSHFCEKEISVPQICDSEISHLFFTTNL